MIKKPLELPNCIDETITTVAKEPAKQIGTMLKDALYLKFGSVSYKAEKRRILEKHGLKEFEKILQQNIDQIPAAKLIEPDFQTLCLALDNAEYCMNSEILRQMFADLIAKSCNSDYQAHTHPSFSEILKQMSPADAKILHFYVETLPDCVLTYTFSNSETGERFDKVTYILDDYSYTDDVEIVSTCFSSLIRLGILALHDDAFTSLITDTNFEKTNYYINSESERIKNGKYNSSCITQNPCIITPFGESFIESCIT